MGDVNQKLHSKRWKALTVWIIVFSAFSLYDHHRTDDLINHNHDQIRVNALVAKNHDKEVQLSRQHSCEQTYLTIREIFLPFVKPKQLRSTKEQKQLNRFLNLTRPAKCKIQTDPNILKKKVPK